MRGSRSSDASVQARREQLLEHVLEVGAVRICDLASMYDVSEMTVHRDLDALSGAGFLTKERGRAVAPPALQVQTSALFRLRAGRRMKEAVARAAVERLSEVSTVLVDDSTSVLPLLRMLGETDGPPVTVVTNYLEAVRQAGQCPRLRPHLLGGDYLPELDATFGAATVRELGRWRVDAAVVSVPAVKDGCCYHALADSAAVKSQALEVADHRVLLLDHTKMPRTGPHLMFDVGRFESVVVDDGADPAEVAAMRARGAHVTVVPVHPMDS